MNRKPASIVEIYRNKYPDWNGHVDSFLNKEGTEWIENYLLDNEFDGLYCFEKNYCDGCAVGDIAGECGGNYSPGDCYPGVFDTGKNCAIIQPSRGAPT